MPGAEHSGPYNLTRCSGFIAKVSDFRHGRLHPVGHFVLLHLGIDFGVAKGFVALFVQEGEAVSSICLLSALSMASGLLRYSTGFAPLLNCLTWSTESRKPLVHNLEYTP